LTARQQQKNPDTEDLIWGAIGIAEAIGVKPSLAYYWLEHGELPARKVGQKWVASRAKLMAYLRGDNPDEEAA
jgi:hypothetical protein